MKEPRAIVYPITLTTPELAYLLTLVEAQTLLGSDEQTLFPREQAKRETQLQQGLAALDADGWLVRDEANHYRINDALMVIIATLAEPEVVILSRIEGLNHPVQGVSHYIARDLVVELAVKQGVYQLVVLDTLLTMARRLAHSIGLAETQLAKHSFMLTRPEAEHAKQHPNSEWLISKGLAPEVAHLFAAALLHPVRYSTHTLFRMYAEQAVTMHIFGVLVTEDGSGWLAEPRNEQLLRYTRTAVDSFATILSEEVRTMRSEPVEG